MSCTVRIIYYDNRDSPITVLPCMCITQETFIDIVMSWYDHYCADSNIFILSYLPCWSCIFFTIAFIMRKSFVCKFVLLMLNIFILVHKWFIWMVVICHVFYCILCCICIFYHVLCQKWQNKAVKSISCCYGNCSCGNAIISPPCNRLRSVECGVYSYNVLLYSGPIFTKW